MGPNPPKALLEEEVPTPDQFIDFTEIHRRFAAGRSEGAHRVALWRGVRAGTFPVPVAISPRRRAWYRDEIDSWAATLPRVG